MNKNTNTSGSVKVLGFLKDPIAYMAVVVLRASL